MPLAYDREPWPRLSQAGPCAQEIRVILTGLQTSHGQEIPSRLQPGIFCNLPSFRTRKEPRAIHPIMDCVYRVEADAKSFRNLPPRVIADGEDLYALAHGMANQQARTENK